MAVVLVLFTLATVAVLGALGLALRTVLRRGRYVELPR